MMTNKVTFLCSNLALILVGLSGCQQENMYTTLPQETNQTTRVDFETQTQSFETADLLHQGTRGIGYTLEGTHKLPKISFGAKGASAGDVPIHAFFRNTHDNQMVYAQLRMTEVAGNKQLKRTFGNINLKGKLNAQNANHWYVKAFVGGYPEQAGQGGDYPNHNPQILQHGTANQIRFLQDGLYDIEENTNKITIPENYCENGKWHYALRPLPMETEWTKVNFSTLGENGRQNPKYASTKLHFKPFGCLLRVRIANKGKKNISLNTFALHEAEVATNSNGQEFIQYFPERILFVNNLLYTFNKPIRTVNGTIDEIESRTTTAPNNGTLTFHWASGNMQQPAATKTIAPGTSRIILAWLCPNPDNSNTQATKLKPVLYIGEHGNYADYVTKGIERIQAPVINVTRNKFQQGKSYPITLSIYSKEDVRIESDAVFNNMNNGGIFIQ